jgi:membrane protease YdiL (CAAX protease family)
MTKEFVTRLVLIGLSEILFMWITRAAISSWPWQSYEAESVRTALRISTAALDWWLMRPLILSRQPNLATLRSLPLIVGILLYLSLNALPFVGLNLPLDKAIFFAATALIVGIKEEFLFRGILQNLLTQRLGFKKGVIIASLIFTAYHVGVTHPSFYNYLSIFMAGLVLGIIYFRSGSLLTVIMIHFAVDALNAFGPFTTAAHFPNWAVWGGIVSLVVVIGPVVLLSFWSSRVAKSTS